MGTLSLDAANHPLNAARRIVIKIGSALVVDTQSDTVRAEWLASLAKDMQILMKEGRDVVLVSSGAVALGRATVGAERPYSLAEKQAAAALGQPRLMQAFQTAFAPQDLPIAQALLTLGDTDSRRRWVNARATLETLLSVGALPIINENDTVATDEIRYGDNDRLAAHVAEMIGADALILLSDVDGLYTADPRKNPDAEYIPWVETLTPEIMEMGGDANAQDNVGSGGMTTKLLAAQIALESGCSTCIAHGTASFPIQRLKNGEACTWIHANVTQQSPRPSWLQRNR